MDEIVKCKHCGRFDFYGEMRWQSGRCMCRACYREDYERTTGKLYEWDDLSGPHPSAEAIEQFEKTGAPK